MNKLYKKADEFIDKAMYNEALGLLTDDKLKKKEDANLYILRGFAWYQIKKYDNAISDYCNALKIDPNNELAFYNKGTAWVAVKNYDEAIKAFDMIVNVDSEYADFYYTARGNVWKAKKEYNNAIEDFNNAINLNPFSENAYYCRGLARKEANIDLNLSKLDFEKYLELVTNKNDIWAKYARYYIDKIDEQKDRTLTQIANIILKIKELLQIEDECITHYTSLSTSKSLIFNDSKFRISEGNSLNDPSEGLMFYKFLEHQKLKSYKHGSNFEIFSPKPFIGSFVNIKMNNDLNLWRFYGKESGEEAKGCAITLCRQEFIDDINQFLSNEVKEARIDIETDIKFYRVVYCNSETTDFFVPDLSDVDHDSLKYHMINLKEAVKTYNGKYTNSLEDYLNSIAFLFKSDAYKNENEVRLVVKGIEFEKKYNWTINPPLVYIELSSIKKSVSKITLGPKVENANEWASAFFYEFKEKEPEIMISHLPYK